MRKVSTEQSLLFLIMAIAAVVIFLPLDAVALFPDEIRILQQADSYIDKGIFQLFATPPQDFATEAYAYLVSANLNLFHLPDIWAVRTPGALIIWILTVGIFHYRGEYEQAKYAFLAALIFLSSYSVSAIAYHATPLTLTTISLITSLASVYHWIKRPSKRKAYLLIATAAVSSFFFGLLAPMAICVVGLIFMALQGNRKIADFFKVPAFLATAAMLAFMLAAFAYNDIHTAGKIMGIGQILEPLSEYSRLQLFALQLLFSIFPWSIPIVIAIGWIITHPQWLKEKFLALSLLKQFGVIIFVLTLPFITALNGLSLIMLLTMIYFNVPIVSHFLLSQAHNHTVTWRITGSIFALLIALFALMFIAALFGLDFTQIGYSIDISGHSNFGAYFLLIAIAFALYSLWRNQRTIRYNNLYFYNIVFLYIWAQLLYKAYVNPFLTVL